MTSERITSPRSAKPFLTAALGVVLLAICALMVLLWFMDYKWRGAAVLVGIVLLMLFAIVVRLRHNIGAWTPQRFYLVRVVEVIAAACLLGAGYLFHMKLVAAYCALAIVVIDRLLHIFFRLQMPSSQPCESEGEPANRKP